MVNSESIANYPFVGLRPFKENESDLFFGREKQIVELMEKLHTAHFIAVIGNSGCGKSSIVKAGLLPRLKAGFLTDQRDIWLIANFRPGDDPIKHFVAAINDALATQNIDSVNEPIISEQKLLEFGPTYVMDILEDLLLETRCNLLILIDQFEELFTIEQADENDLNNDILFVNLILTLIKKENTPIYLIITIRSEYIGKCNKFYGLPEVLNYGQYLIPRLDRQQLKQVIELPVKLLGYKISSRLVDILLNESDSNFDQLPVLQHCLLQTFLRWYNESSTEAIDLANYLDVGQFQGALSVHADRIFAELTPSQQQICVLVFKALSATNPDGDYIRRPQTIFQLTTLAKTLENFNKEDLYDVLEKFSAQSATFLTIDTIEIKDESIVDISHESIFKFWKRLAGWLIDEAASVRKLNWLANNVSEKRELLRGIDLADAITWIKQSGPSEIWAKRYHVSFQAIKIYITRSRKAQFSYLVIKRLAMIFTIAAVITTVFYIHKLSEDAVKIVRINAAKNVANALDAKFFDFYANFTRDKKADGNIFSYRKLDSLKNNAVNYFVRNLSNVNNLPNKEKVGYYEDFKSMNSNLHDYLKIKVEPQIKTTSAIFKNLMQEEVDRAKENIHFVEEQLKLDSTNNIYKNDLSTKYGALSFRLLFIKDFKGAIQAGQKGISLRPYNDWINTDIAEAYLLNKQFHQADSIIKICKEKKVLNNHTQTYAEVFNNDFYKLTKAGVVTLTDRDLLNKINSVKYYLSH